MAGTAYSLVRHLIAAGHDDLGPYGTGTFDSVLGALPPGNSGLDHLKRNHRRTGLLRVSPMQERWQCSARTLLTIKNRQPSPS
jgi:hypothetical protein